MRNLVKAIFLILCLIELNGCVNDGGCSEQIKCDFSKKEYLQFGSPILPPSAELRLLEGLDASAIGDIHSLVYITREYTYLGVSGVFVVTWGTALHASYILRQEPNNHFWRDAKVYRWRHETVIYKNDIGEEITQNVNSLNVLLDLPEEVLTNLIYEVHDLAEWAGAKVPPLKIENKPPPEKE